MPKPKGWRKDPYAHGLASKGVKSSIRYDERSGVWFESQGIVGEVVSLMQMMGFNEIMGKQEAKGYTKTSYESDASKVVILPSNKAKMSVEWLKKEWKTASRPRKNQLLNIVRMARKRISIELGKVLSSSTKVQLHESRNAYNRFLSDVGGV